MSAVKVTDLVAKSLEETSRSVAAAVPADADRHERKARIFADLATAQVTKTAAVISYLNSDRSKWSVADELIVRDMLGLPGGTDEGGTESGFDTAPEPEPEPEPDFSAPVPQYQPDPEDAHAF